jgi:CTP:molybdopterin cytidylyltransferase MocA
MRTLAVLLAAGSGSRFHGGCHKLDAPLTSGHTVYEQSLGHLVEAFGPGGDDGISDSGGIVGVVVVHGSVERPVPAGVTSIVNDAWAAGQATSVAAALHHAASLSADAIVFGLADQPFVPPATWRAVADAAPEWPVVVATYAGRRGPHPVRLHQSVWPLVPTIGDDGARSVLRDHPALVHEVVCEGSPADIDTLEDLERWTNS